MKQVESVRVLCHPATQCQIQAAMLRESQIPQSCKRVVYSALHGFWLVEYSNGRLGVSH
jgi:hypothetical protein